MLAVAYQARDVAGLLRDSRSGQHYRVPMPAEETGIMHLARLIKNRREELGWTQPDLAEAAGVSRPTVQRYETGKTRFPEPEAIRRIFRALGLDPIEIPVILGLVTHEELGRPPAIQPVTRRVSPETEKIIKVLEANGVTDAERKALYDFLVARVNARPETGERRHRAG